MKQLNQLLFKESQAFTRLALFIFLFAGGTPQLLFASDYNKPTGKLYVAPTSGLNVRTQPSLQASVVATLSYNTLVNIVADSTPAKPFQLKVTDFNGGSLLLEGQWVKVNAGNVSGYVFDGMLSRYKGLALGNLQEDAYYAATFGKPESLTIPKTSVEQGHKINYETIIKTYPNGLIEEHTLYDGCHDLKYTFNTAFNEAYWLISRMMIGADAVMDVDITKADKATVLTFYSCS
jgi:hypothetical protein